MAVVAVTLVYQSDAADLKALRRSGRPAPGGAAKAFAGRSVTIIPGDAALPFLLDGGGYRSQIRLTNLDSREAAFELLFANDDGVATNVNLPDGSSVSNIKGTLPAFGVTTIITANTAAKAAIFWGFLNAPDTKIAVIATLDEDFGGDYLGVSYPASNITAKRVVALYDNDVAETQISLVNFNTEESTVTAIIRDDQGTEVFKEEFKMAALTALGYFPTDALASTAGKRGTVEFSVPANNFGGVAALSSRFYDAGAFDNLPSVALP